MVEEQGSWRGLVGFKWFNYKPNTISLFLTRDFMVPADVWQKQLSATKAEALHTGPGQLPALPPPPFQR